MKILISTLLHLIVIVLKFGELNAMEGRGSSSGIGFERQGMRRRAPALASASSSAVEDPQQHPVQPVRKLRPINYMTHDVHLQIADGIVVRADFEGNRIPDSYDFYKHNEYLVRLAKIGGFMTVIYMTKDGSLMGVKAPHPGVHFMEPNERTWFIAFEGECFRVTVNPNPQHKLLPPHGYKKIELNYGNVDVSSGIREVVNFHLIDFYVFKRLNWDGSYQITGATLI